MNRFIAVLILLSAIGWSVVQSGVGSGGQSNVGGGGSGGSSANSNTVGAVFSVLNFGWVDDDSTDNCGTPINSLITAVNAYAGPGIPQVIIPMGAAKKAYKLATASCNIEFDKPVSIHLWGTIDCAQPSGLNCMQFGQAGLGAQAFVPKSHLDGAGVFVGGANLTNALIEIESFNTDTIIDGIQFFNAGATSATLGVCTNYAILFDVNVFEGTVANVQVAQNDSVAGRCGFGNPLGAASQENTIFFYHNILGGGAGPLAAGNCGSIAINEGGSYGGVSYNNIYAYAVDVLLQGNGTRVDHNTLDAAGCANNGVGSAIQYGANSATTAVTNSIIEANNVSVSSTRNPFLLAKSGRTNAGSTLGATTITANANANAVGSTGSLIDTSPCTTNATTGTPCWIERNVNMATQTPGGAASNGWIVDGLVGALDRTAQTANLGTTSIITAIPITATYLFSCEVILTTAAGTSSTLPVCNVAYTDVFSTTSQTRQVTPTLGASSTLGCNGTAVTNPPAGTSCSGAIKISVTSGGTVNVTTTGYASVAAAAMQYTVSSRLTLTK